MIIERKAKQMTPLGDVYFACIKTPDILTKEFFVNFFVDLFTLHLPSVSFQITLFINVLVNNLTITPVKRLVAMDVCFGRNPGGETSKIM